MTFLNLNIALFFFTCYGAIEDIIYIWFSNITLFYRKIYKVCWSESEMKVLVIQPCLTLCDPMNCSPAGSSVHVPDPLAGRPSTLWATREAPLCVHNSVQTSKIVHDFGVLPLSSAYKIDWKQFTLQVNFDIPTHAQLTCSVALWKSNMPASSSCISPKLMPLVGAALLLEMALSYGTRLHKPVSNLSCS